MERAAVNNDVSIAIGVDSRLRPAADSFKKADLFSKAIRKMRVLAAGLVAPASATPHFGSQYPGAMRVCPWCARTMCI